MKATELRLINDDPWLEPYRQAIEARHAYATRREQELVGEAGSLGDFATGYLYFGLHRTDGGEWICREWAPSATELYLVGDFNDWTKHEQYRFKRIDPSGVWELCLDGDLLSHGMHYKLLMCRHDWSALRVPAWARYVVQDEGSKLFSASVWEPDAPYRFRHPKVTHSDQPLLIYEAHVGMAMEREGVGTYREFREQVLPRIVKKGYNAIQLMAIMEHPYYGSFGYQVSSFFAPSSRYGTPDELKELIDEAHRLGLSVIMDLVHSHAVKNEEEGLACYDGSYTQFFHDGERMRHPAWDSMCFDYGKSEVLHFLLSNCKYWLDEFQFDGFRFDGVTSMLYLSHGLGQSFVSYHDYYDSTQDGDAIMYLTLANKMIHEIHPDAITIAEEMSGMPGLARPIDEGGMGFDYRLAMNIPDFWIKLIKEQPDQNWSPGAIWWECTNRRDGERTISYVESHDQALVGDKTVIFRLVDQEMYWHMDKADDHPTVARGIALHKMIRLVTLTTINGGYLNFMGNEFGHPEWIDFPREGNGWSHKYARRQWSLVDNGFLKYAQLEAFDNDLLHHVATTCPNFARLPLEQVWVQNEDQVLAYERGALLYVYNFSPIHAHTDYRILCTPGEYEILLSTDDERYGGYGNIDTSVRHFTSPDPDGLPSQKAWMQVYLPPRTALVMRRHSSASE